jgi:hypothetical protein
MDSPNNQEAGLLFEFLKFGPQEFFFFFFFFEKSFFCFILSLCFNKRFVHEDFPFSSAASSALRWEIVDSNEYNVVNANLFPSTCQN